MLAWCLAAMGGGCGPAHPPVDLLRKTGDALVDGTVAGRTRDWVVGQSGKSVRINNVVRRTLPASPPSRLTFRIDVPKGARLSFACGIPAERQDRPGVEFVVKARRGGREDIVWTSLLDPVQRPAHRRWVPADVDLSRFAGTGVDLVLETRGYEEGDGDPRRAFWGAPVLNVPNRQAPLVVIYLVDTLRADHTTPYGYARDTTPELQTFAQEAVLFESAIAHASWTKPSVASLMTSQLPGRHRAVQLRDALDAERVTLAELLHIKGYATGAAIANSVIYSQGSNFDQGFDVFAGLHGADDRPSKLVEAAAVVDAALQFLDSHRGFPRFLYVHTMDPHVPYAPPSPFDRRYEPHPTPEHPGVDPRSDYKEPLDRERMIAQYDGDIAYGDQEFGRFVRELKARGLFDQALIVFLADHGEEFLDHGKWLHGRSVFDELVRVPLIVKFPGGRDAGRRIASVVQVVDILPTVLESQGLPLPPPEAIAGHPLQTVVRGGAPEPPAVSEISHRGNVAFGMRTRKDKYVRRFSPEEDELYFDLQADPAEKENRFDPANERIRFLKASVEAAMVTNPYRHNLSVHGTGTYELRLRTGGWIEGVEAVGLGPQEKAVVEGNKRKLTLLLRPRHGAPREVAFGVRPTGVPVYLEGSRDGRPLRATEIFIAEQGVHPAAVPLKLPEIESTSDEEAERTENILSPPAHARPGLHVWLTLASGRKVMDLDPATRDQLCALGYIVCGK